jgi:hypothetical protein
LHFAALHNKLPSGSIEEFMRPVLITVVCLLHGLAFAATPAATADPAKKAVATVQPTRATATRMKFQPGQEAASMTAVQASPQARQKAQNPPLPEEANEPEGLSYGTLLAALALMAAIAVRRSNAGRP